MRDAYRYDHHTFPGLDKRQRRRIARRDRRRYVASGRCELVCGGCGDVLWRGFRAEYLSGPLSLIRARCPEHPDRIAYRPL